MFYSQYTAVRDIALHVAVSVILSSPMASTQLPCSVIDEFYIAKHKCIQENSTQEEVFNGTEVETPGCPSDWRALICWPRSVVGEVINSSCPSFLDPYVIQREFLPSRSETNVHCWICNVHNCPSFCYYNLHSLQVTCKGAIAFFHFSILANSSWLLVEGLYLQTLLSLTFVTHAKYFWCYCLVGWGTPFVVVTAWTFLRMFIDNEGCWEESGNMYIWWIIRGAIVVSVFVNFLIFLNIIRILIQKLGSSDIGGNSRGHFSRLTKSTLLLIPLLGVHYILCAFLPDHVAEDLRFHIELGLGSFQGFVVALLYCFLNTEVLTELKRYRQSFQLEWFTNLTRRRSRSTSAEISNTYSTQLALLEKLGQPRKSLACNSGLQTT
ncbi:secretin receptor-like isoform X2 [Mobula hypostoma]|uniref:secretin receptor-like isoform X2 n=1 Tax=Mobula hypostoma TaxID=723540 RepID=UPI002FC339B8